MLISLRDTRRVADMLLLDLVQNLKNSLYSRKKYSARKSHDIILS